MNKYTYILFFATLSLGTTALRAQVVDTSALQRSMIIEREYNPIVRDASKINTLPQVDMPVPSKNTAEYSQWTTIRESAEMPIRTLESATVGATYPFAKQLGYLNFAGGNYTNLRGSAGLVYEAGRNRIGFTFDHISTNGDIESNQFEGVKNRMKSMDNIGRLFYRYRFDPLDLNINLNYTHTSFNYFGLLLNSDVSGGSVNSPALDNQIYNNFNAKVGVLSRGADDAIQYRANIGYGHFNKSIFPYGPTSDKSLSEGWLAIDGGIELPFQEVNRLGLDVALNSFSYNTGLTEQEYKPLGFVNYAVLGLNPYYNLNIDQLKLRLGVRFDLGFNKGKGFMPAPDVKLDWLFSEGYTLFAHAGGGVEFNHFAAADRLNRYISPMGRIDDVYAPIDGTFGVKGNVGYGFSFEVFGGYKWYDNSNFFAQSVGTQLYNVSVPINLKASNFKFGGIVKYKYQQYVDVTLKVQKNNWSVNYRADSPYISVGNADAKPFNQPDFELNAGIDGHITKDLSLSLNYYLGTNRWGAMVQPGEPQGYSIEAKEMKNINELSLGAQYSFLKYFSVNAKVNNLLNAKYDYLYGIPVQGINFLIGAGVKF